MEPIAVSDPSWPAARETPTDGPVRLPGGVRPADLGAQRRLAALRATGWRFGHGADADEAIASFVADGGRTARGYRARDGRVVVPFGFAEAYAGYVAELWAEGAAPFGLSPRLLNAFYRLKRAIPRRAQLAARRVLIRGQGEPDFPRWPFDDSVAALLRFYVRCALVAEQKQALRFRWFWPQGARAAVILTHDVESDAGLRNAVRIADLEQARGLRSSFNIVASEYPIDWGIVEELRERGFELGVHGVFHDRSLFSSRQEFDRQRPALRDMAERVGADGFRSPATHRVNPWLAELPVATTARCRCPIRTSRSRGAAARRGRSSSGPWSSSRTRFRRTTPRSRFYASRRSICGCGSSS